MLVPKLKLNAVYLSCALYRTLMVPHWSANSPPPYPHPHPLTERSRRGDGWRSLDIQPVVDLELHVAAGAHAACIVPSPRMYPSTPRMVCGVRFRSHRYPSFCTHPLSLFHPPELLPQVVQPRSCRHPALSHTPPVAPELWGNTAESVKIRPKFTARSEKFSRKEKRGEFRRHNWRGGSHALPYPHTEGWCSKKNTEAKNRSH
jgi:hypothetical protein